jgi:hypothetical protein
MIRYTPQVSAVLSSLHNNGPQTVRELLESTKLSSKDLKAVIADLHSAPAGSPKKLYISRWLSIKDAKKPTTEPEYSVGDCDDAVQAGKLPKVNKRSMVNGEQVNPLWSGLL